MDVSCQKYAHPSKLHPYGLTKELIFFPSFFQIFSINHGVADDDSSI
jgi:hypothetical protein